MDFYNKEKSTYDSILRQKNLLPSLNLDINIKSQHTSLAERIADKQNELKLSVFIVEQCLYILWAHLDFYMLKAVGFTQQFGNEALLLAEPSGYPGWKVTAEDIKLLKKSLVSVITETFSKQLINTATDRSIAFIEAMLRRIKRLIQFVPVN